MRSAFPQAQCSRAKGGPLFTSLMKRDGGENIFFVGDSFTPSGVDDYCLTNRNFLPPEKGFVYCLNVLRKMDFNYQLINQHVLPTFHFSPPQVEFMLATWKGREPLMRDLFPWDGANFVTRTLDCLAKGHSVEAPNDTVVSPTYVPDLVNAALGLLQDGERGIWHLANEGALTWLELGCKAAEAMGMPT